MRFIEEGPQIPDELLVARDEGRVVFFCGSGVSRAKANLDDFLGLTKKVVSALGVPGDNKINSVLEAIESPKFSGLVSADRIFGLLEREFDSKYIESEVAKALKPNKDVDLSCHKILIDLATTPNNETRLVTTNFELLFESAKPELPVFTQSNLPDVSRIEGLSGITHLHGRVASDYAGADNDGFILTSSEFGRAYLADGWATKFFRAILEKYVVVFVGYTADEPPVNYLLEGLSKTEIAKNNLYAFQVGSPEKAESIWAHKGVKAISYSETDNHKLLWDSLAAWSERARDIDAWFEDKFLMADQGPENLSPHQRGQIAHIVSTFDGANRLANREKPIPAEWLCVLDFSIRCARPREKLVFLDDSITIIPLERFGLDGESYPPEDKNEHSKEWRSFFGESWDAFIPTKNDLKDITLNHLKKNIEGQISHAPQIYPRLAKIFQWIVKVSNQPICMWWAAGRYSLVESIKNDIRFHLDSGEVQVNSVVREAWSILFETDHMLSNGNDFRWLHLCESVSKHGWNESFVRELGRISKPTVRCFRPAMPESKECSHWGAVLSAEIRFPYLSKDINVSSEYLLQVSYEVKRNINLYMSLETQFPSFSSIHYFDVFTALERSNHSEGIEALLTIYLKVLDRLITENPNSLKDEVSGWLTLPHVFPKIKLWLLSQSNLFTDVELSDSLMLLNQKIFWDPDLKSSLLKLFKIRWNDLEQESRVHLESILLQGQNKTQLDHLDIENQDSLIAWNILNMMAWLNKEGIKFESFNFDDKFSELNTIAGDWNNDSLMGLDSDGIGGVRSIPIDDSYSFLLELPSNKIITEARKASGYDFDGRDHKDPFGGLSKDKPELALSALKASFSESCVNFPANEWQIFLRPDRRKTDSTNLTKAIAEVLVKAKDNELLEILSSLVAWFKKANKPLYEELNSLHSQLLAKLISILIESPDSGVTSIVISKSRKDWLMTSINSPSGQITEILITLLGYETSSGNVGKSAEVLDMIEGLLRLSEDICSYVLVVLGRQINFLFHHYPDWVSKKIFPYFEGNYSGALWEGLYSSNFPENKLFLKLKPLFMEQLVTQKSRSALHFLTNIYIFGWAGLVENNEKLVSDMEVRESLLAGSEDFRLTVIWRLDRLLLDNEKFDFLKFFNDVWPKQLIANSSRVSARLADLALLSLGKVNGLAEKIIPLLKPSEEADFILSSARRQDEKFYPDYNEEVLSVLVAVLSDDAYKWPYGVIGTLNDIEVSDELISSDPRFIELKRRWNSRK